MAEGGEDGLDWLLQLDAKVDKALGMLNVVEKLDVTLNKLADSMGKTEGASKKVEEGHKKHKSAIDQLEHAVHKLIEQSLEPLVKKFEQVAEFEIFRKLTDALLETPEKIFDFLKDLTEEMITTAAAAERTNTAFGLLFGQKEGSETLEYLEGISKFTEFSGMHAKDAALELRKMGFEGEGLRRALAGAHDIAAFSARPEEGFQSALMTLERIKSSGRVDSRSLRGVGISTDDFFKSLSDRTGVAVSTLKKQVEQGKVKSEDMLETLYTLIGSKTGKALGGAAVQMSTTLSAQLTHLRALPEEFYEKLADSPGLALFKDALGHVLEALDPNSDSGREIMGSLDRYFTKLGELVGGIDGDALATNISAIVGMLPDLVSGFKAVGDVIGSMVTGLTKAWDIVKFINKPWAGASEKKEGNADFARDHQDMALVQRRLNEQRRQVAADAAAGITRYGPAEDPSVRLARMRKQALEETKLGRDAGLGLAGGMDQTNKLVEKAGGDLGLAAAVGTANKLAIHSPSKLFADFGRMTAAGFVDGIQTGTDEVDTAVSRMFDQAPSGGGAGTSTAPIQVNVYVTVQVGSATTPEAAHALGAEVGEQLSAIFPAALVSAFQRAAAQTGTQK